MTNPDDVIRFNFVKESNAQDDDRPSKPGPLNGFDLRRIKTHGIETVAAEKGMTPEQINDEAREGLDRIGVVLSMIAPEKHEG